MNDLKNNLAFLIFFKYFLLSVLLLSIILPVMFCEDLFIVLSNYHIYDASFVALIIFVLWCIYRLVVFIKKEIKNV